MNKISRFLFTFLIAIIGTNNPTSPCQAEATQIFSPSNQCISFYVGQGTGCSWMCNYCSNSLGTNNYYFTDNVCTYESGIGCVGSPVAGKSYTCCSSSTEYLEEDLFLNEWD